MSRHTPGPWSADNTGIHGYRVLANDERRTEHPDTILSQLDGHVMRGKQ